MSTGTLPSFRKTASSGEGGDFEIPPSGVHPSVLVAIIDLGTHESTYNGKTKDRHKLAFVWELTAEIDSKGNNFLIIQDYTWSLAANSGLRPIVEGYRGKALADGEEYDPIDMLGKPCMLTITEGISGKGKKFMEVSSVAPPMRGLTVPPPSREPFAFSLELVNSTADPIDIPIWVPRLYGRNVTDDIRASKEYAKVSPF